MESIFKNNYSHINSRRGRRTIALVLVCVLFCVCFAACRSSKKSAPEGIKLAGGRTLEMGVPLDETPFEGLLERQESNSCIGSGTDVYYKYEGFSVTAYPDGKGGHYVGMIKIIGTGIETLSGLRVGMTYEEVKANIHSSFSEDAGILSYNADDGSRIMVYCEQSGEVTRIIMEKS